MYEKRKLGARVRHAGASAVAGSRALAVVLGGAGVGLLVAGTRPGLGWALILAGASGAVPRTVASNRLPR